MEQGVEVVFGARRHLAIDLTVEFTELSREEFGSVAFGSVKGRGEAADLVGQFGGSHSVEGPSAFTQA